jgi:hypothetical protein
VLDLKICNWRVLNQGFLGVGIGVAIGNRSIRMPIANFDADSDPDFLAILKLASYRKDAKFVSCPILPGGRSELHREEVR